MKWLNQFLNKNKNKKILIMPIGISGAGKTTLYRNLSQNFSIEYISFDKIRVEHFLNNFPEYKNKPFFEIYKKAYFYASESKLKLLKIARQKILKTEKNIIYIDNTNLKKKSRRKFLNIKPELIKIGIYFEIDLKTAIDRQENIKRDKKISSKIIEEQFKMLEKPEKNEFNIIINPWHRPTFPTGLPASIMGAEELNCRVRNGTGCDLLAMGTREKAK